MGATQLDPEVLKRLLFQGPQSVMMPQAVVPPQQGDGTLASPAPPQLAELGPPSPPPAPVQPPTAPPPSGALAAAMPKLAPQNSGDYNGQNPEAYKAFMAQRPVGPFDKLAPGTPGADSWSNRHNDLRHALANVAAGVAEFGGELNHHPGLGTGMQDEWNKVRGEQANYDNPENQAKLKAGAMKSAYDEYLKQGQSQAEIGKTTAQTGQATAATGLSQAETAKTKALTPFEVQSAEQGARTAKTGADVAEQTAPSKIGEAKSTASKAATEAQQAPALGKADISAKQAQAASGFAGAEHSKAETAMLKNAPQGLEGVQPKFYSKATDALLKTKDEYASAAGQADTMSEFIREAKSGNKSAVRIVPLEGALDIVTSAGTKRINSTEVHQYGSAGNAYDRLVGKIGGIVTGKDISDDVLKDMQAVTDSLKGEAKKLHKSKVDAINSTYGSTFKPSELTDGAGGGTPTPQTHGWSVSAWQRANQGQDATAMSTAMKAKGFQILP